MSPPSTIALALVFRAEKLLITRRLPGTHLAGSWEFPGGKLKLGETPERCAEREVKEETAVVCQARGCRTPFSFTYEDRSLLFIPVDCIWIRGEPELLQVSAACWILPTELKDFEFPEANSTLIAQLAAK